MAKDNRGSLVGQLPGCDAAGVSLLQSHGTNSLSHCCRVAWNCQFPIFCSGCVVGSLWRDAACRCGCEFPCDRGGLVRRRSIERICRTAKRGVDAHPANPLNTAAAYKTSTIAWKFTSTPASRITPKTAHDAPAAKNRKLTIPSHTAAMR